MYCLYSRCRPSWDNAGQARSWGSFSLLPDLRLLMTLACRQTGLWGWLWSVARLTVEPSLHPVFYQLMVSPRASELPTEHALPGALSKHHGEEGVGRPTELPRSAGWELEACAVSAAGGELPQGCRLQVGEPSQGCRPRGESLCTCISHRWGDLFTKRQTLALTSGPGWLCSHLQLTAAAYLQLAQQRQGKQ